MAFQIDEESLKTYQQLDQTQKTYSMVENRLQYLSAYVEESKQIIATLEEIQNREKDEKVMIPVGNKILLPVKLIETSKVLYSIGSDVKQEISIDKAVEEIKNEIKQLENAIQQTKKQKQQLEHSMNTLQMQLQQQQQQQNQQMNMSSNLKPVIDEDED